MRTLLLLLFILPYIHLTQVVTCTNGFTLVNNKCWKLFPTPTSRKNATKACSEFAGNLVMVKNEEENLALSNFIGNSTKRVWLGLYCFSNNLSKCLWDDGSGSAERYHNFAENFPRVEIDNCVFYKARGSWAGKWLSGDCVEDMRSFVCELPTTFEDDCALNFNGSCYISSENRIIQKTFGMTLAQQLCEISCANLVSIHSSNENRLVQNYYRNTNFSAIHIGVMQNIKSQFMWIDGSASDYSNFHTAKRFSALCPKMSLRPNLYGLPSGSWFVDNCDSEHYFMCKRPAGIPCRPKAESRTITSNCNSLIMAPGSFSSPNYPESYPNYTNCSYTLATLGAQRIRLTFSDISTERGYDFIRVYDGDSLDSPLLSKFSGKPGKYDFESSSNTMLVTFISDLVINASGFTANFVALT